MRTSSAFILAVAAAAAGAFGYRWLMPADAPAATQHAEKHEGGEAKEDKGGNQHVEKDEHGADRIVISDVKLAAAGATFAEAGPATLTDTLSFNGVLRANQETVVQVTPRFPGIARGIKRRIGDVVAKDDLLASIESNQSLTVYDLKAPIAGTVIDRQISLGEYVSEQKPAFVVADLSTIWVDLSIYRQDLRRVRIGDEVLIDPDDAASDIKGKISYLAPVGASETQTAHRAGDLAEPRRTAAAGPVRDRSFGPCRAEGAGRGAGGRDPNLREQDGRVRAGRRRQARSTPRRARGFRPEVRGSPCRHIAGREVCRRKLVRREGRHGQGRGRA